MIISYFSINFPLPRSVPIMTMIGINNINIMNVKRSYLVINVLYIYFLIQLYNKELDGRTPEMTVHYNKNSPKVRH